MLWPGFYTDNQKKIQAKYSHLYITVWYRYAGPGGHTPSMISDFRELDHTDMNEKL